jgi:hypothetical protein
MIEARVRWLRPGGSAIMAAMVTVGRIRVAIAMCAAALALAGCGTAALLPLHGHGGSSSRPVGQDGPAADPADVAVVRRWASALRNGDIRGAAEAFKLPSVFVNGPTETLEIHTLSQAEAIQASLPCGAEVISAFRDGRYVNVLFRLVDRRGRGGGAGACGSGVGQTARTDFLIRDGHIAAWLRAASRPGDPGVPTPPSPGQTSTGTLTGPAV